MQYRFVVNSCIYIKRQSWVVSCSGTDIGSTNPSMMITWVVSSEWDSVSVALSGSHTIGTI